MDVLVDGILFASISSSGTSTVLSVSYKQNANAPIYSIPSSSGITTLPFSSPYPLYATSVRFSIINSLLTVSATRAIMLDTGCG